MELVLELPAGWRTTALGRRRAATAPGGRVTVTWSPALERLPVDLDGWRWRELGRELAGDAELLPVRELVTHTVDGWPLHLAEIDAPHERRLAAFFVFLEHASSVLVRAADGAALEQVRVSLVEALQRARPRFRDDAGVAVAAFWRPLTPATER